MDSINKKPGLMKEHKYAFVQTWGEIKENMALKINFLIRTREVTFWLPLNATSGLRKAIKRSLEVEVFTIQEDEFNKSDWLHISQGLIERKPEADLPAKLKITFTKITKKNLPFIRGILRKATIIEVTFHDCVIEEKIWDDFCKALERSSEALKTIHFTTNKYTNEQIKHIQDVVSGVKKQLVLYQSEIRIIRSSSEVKNDINRCVFRNMQNIYLSDSPEDPRFCYAVKMSPCITTVTFVERQPVIHWNWMQEALLENNSIRKIVFLSFKFHLLVLPTLNALIASNRIEEIEFDARNLHNEEIQQLAKLIRSNKSLKHLTITGQVPELGMIEAITSNATLKSITFEQLTMSLGFVVELLQASRQKLTLTFRRVNIPADWEQNFATFLHSNCKELHLHYPNIGATSWFKRLCKEVHHKTLTAFSLTVVNNPDVIDDMILRGNSTLQKLNLMWINLAPKSSLALLDALRDHPTITSFGFHLTVDCFSVFADLIEHNTRIKVLKLSFESLSSDHHLIVQRAIGNNNTIQKLSLAITQENLLKVLAKNESIGTLTLIACYWDPSNVKINPKLKQLLESNTTISNITLLRVGIGEEVVPLSTEIQLLVNRNKEYQINGINTTLQVIGTMAARPHVYLSLLPLELWSNIFKRIRFSSAHNDFGETFLRAVQLKI